MTLHLRVVKVGGSLFDLPDLPMRWARWNASQEPAASILIAGGGGCVEALRKLDRRHQLGAETSHWLSIEAMSLTARVLRHVLPDARLCHSLDEVRSAGHDAGPCVLDVRAAMELDARGSDRLPLDWSVTSDSIAARIADRLSARELVLLKSTLPASHVVSEWSQSGFVDSSFLWASAAVPHIRAVNLRDECAPEVLASMCTLGP